MNPASQVSEPLDILLRGCDSVYTEEELRRRLASGKVMRVKLGMDPTAPDLTLGHTVVLRKLRQFQDLGHKAVLIIGDYTARIGDPTGRSKARPILTPDEITANADTYLEQAGKVLDLSDDKLEVRRNSEWLSPMTFADVIKLMSRITVARMLERDTFANRQKEGKEIYLHELLYPLMQARDSVAIEADVELGGTDQTFNNLCGRDLQRQFGQTPQLVMLMPILVGIDGREKMSKSTGNYIALTDPPSEMFGKIMRMPDEVIPNYFELLTDLPPAQIAALTDPAQANPRDTKEKLARMIITQYHSADDADAAAAEFQRVHGGGRGGLPDEMPEVTLSKEKITDGRIAPLDLISFCGFGSSRSDGRRLIKQGGLRLNDRVLEDALTPVEVKSGDIVQRGKRRFVRLIVP